MDSDEKRVLKRKRHTIAQNVTLTEELVEALRNSNLLTNSIYDQVIVSAFWCNRNDLAIQVHHDVVTMTIVCIGCFESVIFVIVHQLFTFARRRPLTSRRSSSCWS